MPKRLNADNRESGPVGVPLLQVYVARHCPSCEEARRLARLVDSLFPTLTVHVIDLDESPADAVDVFAVPTYVFNGRVCFLGNPSEEELCEVLGRLLESSLEDAVE
ncbi:hypothetical protein HRbin10_00741 [bacterium HR10]|nr:hypothetical protein HRbin10_00741 [bacterium HR10]